MTLISSIHAGAKFCCACFLIAAAAGVPVVDIRTTQPATTPSAPPAVTRASIVAGEATTIPPTGSDSAESITSVAPTTTSEAVSSLGKVPAKGFSMTVIITISAFCALLSIPICFCFYCVFKRRHSQGSVPEDRSTFENPKNIVDESFASAGWASRSSGVGESGV